MNEREIAADPQLAIEQHVEIEDVAQVREEGFVLTLFLYHTPLFLSCPLSLSPTPQELIAKHNSVGECAGEKSFLDLGAYLIMPIQRLPRYELLIREVSFFVCFALDSVLSIELVVGSLPCVLKLLPSWSKSRHPIMPTLLACKKR